jgi:hypothetical protein
MVIVFSHRAGLAACLAEVIGIVLPADSFGQRSGDALSVEPVQVSF